MTMGLISLVLIVVFVSLLISTYTQQRRQIDMSLNQAVGQGFGLEAPKERFGRRDDPGGNFAVQYLYSPIRTAMLFCPTPIRSR